MALLKPHRKRKRIPDVSPNVEPRAPDVHELFTEWAKERGVEINGVKPKHLLHRGLGLSVTKPIKAGERILFVPEKAMFKPQAHPGQRSYPKAASPQAQLTLSLMAACEKPKSQYTKWQKTWPLPVDFVNSVPMMWDEHSQSLLPPSVTQPFDRQKADYSRDWNASSQYCSEHKWAESDFKYYWLIVNSRSFHWKTPKGRSGSMVMCPFIDYMNHGPTGTTCNVHQTSTGYEVIADREYEIHDEILATYGAHSNDKLLVHYGFIISPGKDTTPSTTPTDDDIRLDHLIIPQLPEPIRTQLQDVGYLGAYALLPHTNDICFKTQVAVRAALLTCNEWEYFATNGEDLTTDQTQAVRRWLEPLLKGYGELAHERLKELAGWKVGQLSGNSTQIMALLYSRWSQISSAIDAFLKLKK